MKILGLLLFLPNLVFASANITGELYLLSDTEKKNKIYDFKQVAVVDAKTQNRKVTNEFRDKDGKLVMTESGDFQGDKLTAYDFKHDFAEESGSVVFKEDGVHFSYTKEGETKTNTERLRDDIIIGPSLTPFLNRNWDKIKSGQQVSGRFVALDRRETLEFYYKKVATEKHNGADAIVVKMWIANPILRVLVDPIYFTYVESPLRLMHSKGRMLVKYNNGKKWVKQDYIVDYKFPEDAKK